jgi:hypothetical protein
MLTWLTVMRGESTGPEPTFCAPLLRRVDEKLIDLLKSLTPDEWGLQTIAPLWMVPDIAGRLLDTVLRKLSMVRHSCCVEAVSIGSRTKHSSHAPSASRL